MRLRIDLAYDGGDFHGWAAQPGLRTVQGDLEAALATVLRLPTVLRLQGTADWLGGHPAAARRRWKESLKVAELSVFPIERALTLGTAAATTTPPYSRLDVTSRYLRRRGEVGS